MVVYFLNSAVVTLGSVFFILLGSLAAYAISRLGSFSRPLSCVLRGRASVAPQSMVPLYVIVDTLGARGLAARHHPRHRFQLPVAVLILTGFVQQPQNLLDAAFIDGATEWVTYRHRPPLTRPPPRWRPFLSS